MTRSAAISVTVASAAGASAADEGDPKFDFDLHWGLPEGAAPAAKAAAAASPAPEARAAAGAAPDEEQTPEA